MAGQSRKSPYRPPARRRKIRLARENWLGFTMPENSW
jgi:hypothetical protein